MDSIHTFDGLNKRLPAFLRELGDNNSAEWFHAHREEYLHSVAMPLAALAEILAPDIALIDNSLVKRLSRPRRDTRFSRDKSPYRTEVWFAFRSVQPNWTEFPAFFFEATPEHCRWGMGYYSARPTTMSVLRDIAQEKQKRFLAALASATRRGFALHGDLYKRHPPVPADMPKEIAELIRRRNAYLCRTAGYGPLLLSGELTEMLAADYAALGAMYRFFCMAHT
ncbi:MAG: DUF2461 domain-containing protein [Proteobacteria bacterium]|nr:DUF2461 domain-containing protein [Pseudomonadota bacterium]